MPYFSEETLEGVRSIPLYEIVRAHMDLTRSGKNWKGLSPFTNEKSPSFFVLTDKNYFKCHSSGLGGDGIKFIQETERLNFSESVEALAERFNVPIKYASGAGPDPQIRSLKQELLDIHDYARDYYHQAFLAGNKHGEGIREYWTEGRGFSLDLAKEFQIGFAPVEDRSLLGLLQKKGFSVDALAKSGLFHPGRDERNPDSWYFTFRGRLMVPIRNIQGQVIAFTARQLDVTPREHASWKAKYINSPETLIFKKGQLLFNMERAKEGVKDSGCMILVEGQLDALRCWDCGLRHAVAPQGTSITEEQLGLVKRYTDSLEVLLDSDEAGSKAILRMLPLAFKSRLQVQVYNLPKGNDPDDFLREGGPAAMESLQKESGIQYAGRYLMGPGNPSPEQKSKALQGLFEILSNCSSAVVREGYFEEAVHVTGVSQSAAYADFQRFSKSVPRGRKTAGEINIQSSGTNASETLTNLEGDLLWSVLKKLEWADSLEQVIDQKWIKSDTLEGRILSLILGQATVDHIETANEIYFLLETDEERDCFNHYNQEPRLIPDMGDFVTQTITAMIHRFYRTQLEKLDQEISNLNQTTTDPASSRELFLRKRELMRDRNDLSMGLSRSLSLNA